MNKGVIDIGNTRVKAAVFNSEGEMISEMHSETRADAFNWLKSFDVSVVMAATVGQATIDRFDDLDIISLTHNSFLPFVNQYKSPETLGVDRLAAMAAASVLYPGQAVLVFDIGTCMTIDLLRADNVYVGGNISPGIRMRLMAMHQMTGRLPLVEINEPIPELGDTTRNALASGVLTGMKFEIEGYIHQHSMHNPELIIILTGGDHLHFDIRSKNRIFAAPNFVLHGLYHLLTLNET